MVALLSATLSVSCSTDGNLVACQAAQTCQVWQDTVEANVTAGADPGLVNQNANLATRSLPCRRPTHLLEDVVSRGGSRVQRRGGQGLPALHRASAAAALSLLMRRPCLLRPCLLPGLQCQAATRIDCQDIRTYPVDMFRTMP